MHPQIATELLARIVKFHMLDISAASCNGPMNATGIEATSSDFEPLHDLASILLRNIGHSHTSGALGGDFTKLQSKFANTVERGRHLFHPWRRCA